MILQTRDEQERRTFTIVKVDLDRLVRIERGQSILYVKINACLPPGPVR
jgi:hypothetical protein